MGLSRKLLTDWVYEMNQLNQGSYFTRKCWSQIVEIGLLLNRRMDDYTTQGRRVTIQLTCPVCGVTLAMIGGLV